MKPFADPADDQKGMRKEIPPMTSAERQREFVARNPGYYRKYRARRQQLYPMQPQTLATAEVSVTAAVAAATEPSSTTTEFTLAAMAA